MSGCAATQRVGVSFDQFFQENYESLQIWALRITKYDQELAEDILHDVYVRLNQRNLNVFDVGTIHGYIYTALKNAYVSHVRHVSRKRSVEVSVVEQDLAENESLTTDARYHARVRDELFAICEFACRRKDTSISASILILRFFHGYHANEVAKIIKRPRQSVEARLYSVRREVRLELLAPEGVEQPKKKKLRVSRGIQNSGIVSNDFITELRENIVAANDGPCPPAKDLHYIYENHKTPVDRKLLSHIVGCEYCLDKVNNFLSLPLLRTRHPLDSLQPYLFLLIFAFQFAFDAMQNLDLDDVVDCVMDCSS